MSAVCPSQVETEVAALINQERQKNGLGPLAIDHRLTEAARLHSQDMAAKNYFSHDSLDGSDFIDRMERAGYLRWTTAAENIAAGYLTAQAVVEGWMGSPGHRANILRSGLREMGIGYGYGSGSQYGRYWTTDFGTSTDGPVQIACSGSQYILSVVRTGLGTVVASPGPLVWTGDSGSATYAAGTGVGLTASPGTGYFFAGWSGGCQGSGSCLLFMNADTTVNASFISRDAILNLVNGYYDDILGRPPDSAGADQWTDETGRIVSLGVSASEGFQALAKFFFNSSEYVFRGRTDAQFVADLYETFFNRQPDAAGASFWSGQLAAGLTRNMLITYFVNSAEFSQLLGSALGTVETRPENNLVNDFYRAFLNRFPDSQGFDLWLDQMRAAQCSGASAVTTVSGRMAGDFFRSAEYAARNRTNAQFIEDLYNGILRRGADVAGFQAWTAQLNAGTSRSSVLNQFIASPEFSGRVNSVIAAGCLP